MSQAAFDTFTDQTKKFYAPVARLNWVIANSIGKITEFQLSTIRSFADLGISQLKNITCGASAEEIPSPVSIGHTQAEFFNAISSQAVENFKKMGELSNEIKEAMDDLFKDSLTIFSRGQESVMSAANTSTQ